MGLLSMQRGKVIPASDHTFYVSPTPSRLRLGVFFCYFVTTNNLLTPLLIVSTLPFQS